MNYAQFRTLWEKLSNIWGTDEDVEKENKLIEEIEENLPFKDREEHDHWLQVLQGFKFWEDFEELTLSIAKRLDIDDRLVDHYYWVAKDLARKSTFTKLLDIFRELEREWIGNIYRFRDWFYYTLDDDAQEDYKNNYKEFCDRDFDFDYIEKHYVAYEKCTVPFFYTNDEEGLGDLIDCIFERYIDSMENWELIEFLSKMIGGLLK